MTAFMIAQMTRKSRDESKSKIRTPLTLNQDTGGQIPAQPVLAPYAVQHPKRGQP